MVLQIRDDMSSIYHMMRKLGFSSKRQKGRKRKEWRRGRGVLAGCWNLEYQLMDKVACNFGLVVMELFLY